MALLGYIAVLIAVYYFALKLRGYNVQPAPQPAQASAPEPTASDLEREAERSPSYRNRVAAGFAWLDESEPARALRCFELALRTHPREREAQYGLGLARLRLGDHAAAVAALAPIVERSFAYEEYGAALALAEAYFAAGELDRAFELVSDVMRDSGRIEHALVLARHQLRTARKDDARATLRAALEQFAAQPDAERRRDGALATEARRLLRTLGSDEPAL